MTTKTQFVQGARVRKAGVQDDYKTPESFPKITNDVSGLQMKDLRNMRSRIAEGINMGTIADRDMVDYMEFRDLLDSEIVVRDRRNRQVESKMNQGPAVVRSVGDSKQQMAENFSITRAILAASERGVVADGIEAEVISEGKRENPMSRGNVVLPSWMARSIFGVDSTQSGIDSSVNGKQTLAAGMKVGLHRQPLAVELGATLIDATGSATFLLPWLGRTSAASAAEGASVSSAASMNDTTLSPIRYTRKTTFSALSLRSQAGGNLDTLLLQDFAAAHASQHDKAAFDAIIASATYTAATEAGTDALAVTDFGDIMNLANDVVDASGRHQSPDLVCSPKGFKFMNTISIADQNQSLSGAYRAGTGANVIQCANLVDGDLDATKVLADSAAGTFAGAGVVVGGLFEDLVIANWGFADLLVDQLSGASEGLISVYGTTYSAAGIVRDSFRVLGVTDTQIAKS